MGEVLAETIAVNQNGTSQTNKTYDYKIVWRNVFLMSLYHILALIGAYYHFFVCSWTEFFLMYLLHIIIGQGITSGVHRLWSHRAYKAKLPLRIVLMLLNTACNQNSIYVWVRDHRVHHKYADTDADPHNSLRGFFFSHMGWLLVTKHEDVKTKGKTVDMRDLEADKVVMFQHKYFPIAAPVFSFVLPALIPWYFLNQSLWVSFLTMGMLRHIHILHSTWSVNSVAHMFGTKPYDKEIYPVQNMFVSFVALGEGFHNYHHVFSWDYRVMEFNMSLLNWSKFFIDAMAKIGWAYDLKTVSDDMINKRSARTGDSSRKLEKMDLKEYINKEISSKTEHVWGWESENMDEEDKKFAKIHYKLIAT